MPATQMSCYLYTQQSSFRNNLPTLNDCQCLLKCINSQDFIVTIRNSTFYKSCHHNFSLHLYLYLNIYKNRGR